jgi:hypothetical protein
MTTKQVKKVNQHLINVTLQELQELIPLVVEFKTILQELKATSLSEFEFLINERSGFVSASLSATAYGLEKPYNRLLSIERLIDGKISLDDLTSGNALKNTVKDTIIEKFTEYFTDEEIKVKEELDKVIRIYNALDFHQRQHIGYNRNRELAYTPFSDLRY